MNEDNNDNKESKDKRFYEPRNWDKFMQIEDKPAHVVCTYCGKCGHIIYEGDSFCTKCGVKSRKEN